MMDSIPFQLTTRINGAAGSCLPPLPLNTPHLACDLRRAQAKQLAACSASLQRQASLLSIGEMIHSLQGCSRQQLVLKLIHQVFPEKFQIIYQADELSSHLKTRWVDMLSDFLSWIVQADLVPIDTSMVDDVYRCWMETGEAEDLDQLAEFLKFIPLKTYGFTGEENARNFPAMFLLHYLLAEPTVCAKLNCRLCQWKIGIVNEEIPEIQLDEDVMDRLADWTELDRQTALLRLQYIQDHPEQWPEPIRHLPMLGSWAAHLTGNLLLDKEISLFDEGGCFTWDEMDWVYKLSRQAQPQIQLLKGRVSNWLATDCSDKLNSLARFVANGVCDYALAW